MTVIVIVLIGVVAAVGLVLIPKLMTKIKFRSCCNEIGGYVVRCRDGLDVDTRRRGNLCRQWRSDQTDHSAFVRV